MSTTMPHATHRMTHVHTGVQWAALIVGAVFVLFGVLGFIPGITTDYDEMTFAGPDSGAKLLGVFEVSVLHNIVHLLLGGAGLWMSRTVSLARTYLLAGGVVYLALALYGVLVDESSGANFVPVNPADNWLHLGLGAAMIILGAALGRRSLSR